MLNIPIGAQAKAMSTFGENEPLWTVNGDRTDTGCTLCLKPAFEIVEDDAEYFEVDP